MMPAQEALRTTWVERPTQTYAVVPVMAHRTDVIRGEPLINAVG